MLAQQHIQYNSVNLIVHTVIRKYSNFIFGLAESIHSPLALLMARRIPAQIIVHNCIKVVL